MRDFFDPSADELVVVLVERSTIRKAEELIESCEASHPEGAEIPFDHILDRVTGADPSVTGCPKCHCDILEKTLVEPA